MKGRALSWPGRRVRALRASRSVVAGAALLLAQALVGGCARPRAAVPTPQEGAAQLMEADRAFGRETAARGLEGWMSFFAADAVSMNRLANPIRGAEAIRKADKDNFSNPNVRLTWEPVDAAVYADGTHGWTIGRYAVRRRAADGTESVTGQGRYMTIWRREPDGRWLVILDTGVSDPPTAK